MPSAAKLIPIVKIPDPVLRQIAKPVDEITDGVRQLLDDMAATMYDACLLYTSPSPRDAHESRMPSSA